MLAGGLLALLLVTALAAQQWRLFERAWFALQQPVRAAERAPQSAWLADYRVLIEARPIAGLSDLSALTYDPQRNSLFSVTNRHSELVELSLDGRLLRRIALHGFADPEAVEYIAPGQLMIADERRQSLYLLRIDDDTRELHAEGSEQLTLNLAASGNKGFEGLAYDAS
ncbi:TPA: SdiA-regulated domain-containing protein, partial [Klebsiella pneumoniae]